MKPIRLPPSFLARIAPNNAEQKERAESPGVSPAVRAQEAARYCRHRVTVYTGCPVCVGLFCAACLAGHRCKILEFQDGRARGGG